MPPPSPRASRAAVIAVLVVALVGTGLAIWGLGAQTRVSSDSFDVRSAALDPRDGVLQEHMAWAIGLFQGESVTPAEVEARLSPELLDIVPVAKFIDDVAFIARDGPFEIRGYEGPTQGVLITNLQAANGDIYDLHVAVDPQASNRQIVGLFILLADAPRGPFTVLEAIAHIGSAWGLLLAGAAAWLLRHRARAGQLLLLAGALWLAQMFELSNLDALYTLGLIAAPLGAVAVGLALLSYGQRGQRSTLSITVALAVVAAGVMTLAPLLVIDTSLASLPDQLLSVRHDRSLAITLNAIAQSVTIAASTCLALVLWQRYRQGSGIGKRWRSTFAVIATVGAAVLIPLALWGLSGDHYDLSMSPIVSLATLAVPVGVGAAVVRDRYALGDVASMVAGADGAPSRSSLQDSLATVLGDPTVELAFWSASEGGYFGSDGRPVSVQSTPTRAVTALEAHGGPIGAVLHDPALEDEPGRVRAASAAVSLALENERLQAVVAAELRSSRARLVESANDARRQMERDLHDGAQQRLIALQLSVQLEVQRAQRSGQPVSPEFLQSMTNELGGAVEELRELGRGLRPSALDHGLRAALDSLAERSPLPIVTKVSNERVPAAVEEVAYFVISEAVANATRHSQADHVTVATEVDAESATLTLRVSDDGIGGATKNGGTGLQSLEDRVVALDGTWSCHSPAGVGTTITASIPFTRNPEIAANPTMSARP